MKVLNYVLSCLIITIIFSCSSDDGDVDKFKDCKDQFLIDFNMIEYSGGEIACGTSYLVLFEADGTVFPLLRNDCADIAPQLLVDCEGNELCMYATEEGCFEFVQDAQRIGIFGVRR